MAGDYAPNIDRYGNAGREDPSRSLGLSYGSLGPWAGAVMQGFGNAMNPTQLTGLTPEEMMAGRAGGMSSGGLLDVLGGWSGGGVGNQGMNAGAMG